MNTWDSYKSVEDTLRGACEKGIAQFTAIVDPIHRIDPTPMTASWLEDHLLALKLQVAFVASAHAQLELIEATEGRRALTNLAPLELFGSATTQR